MDPFGCGCQNQWDPSFGVFGELATHFRTYFSGDWDVHWGYDLDFDPWPFGQKTRFAQVSEARQCFGVSCVLSEAGPDMTLTRRLPVPGETALAFQG